MNDRPFPSHDPGGWAFTEVDDAYIVTPPQTPLGENLEPINIKKRAIIQGSASDDVANRIHNDRAVLVELMSRLSAYFNHNTNQPA